MISRLNSSSRTFPLILGGITLAGVAGLLLQDAFPQTLSSFSHKYLEAFALAGIAAAYLLYQALHWPRPAEMVKAILLAIAFLFWAANQVWPNAGQATLLNDLAIGLFVLDVVLVMAGWPAAPTDAGFGESGQ